MKHAPYEVALESRVENARPTYRFHTADGVASKRSFRTAELLLAETLWDRDPGRLLVAGANYGVVGCVLADTARSVTMTESSARAVQCCERNVAENDADASVRLVGGFTPRGFDTLAGLSNPSGEFADRSGVPSVTGGDVPVSADGATDADGRRFDTAAYAPKPYTPLSVGTQRLADALARVRPGGRLYLAATKHAGLARYEDCLRDLVPTVNRVDRQDGCTVLAATRPPSFDRSTEVTPRTLAPTVDGRTLSLVLVPGMFSPTELDHGTRLLLETATVDDGANVLDLCCGYGAMGAYAGTVADCEVWCTDVDRFATACARRSLDASGVDGRVVTADCTEGVADRTFDTVLCNPPTHAGDGVLAELFRGVTGVLASDGTCLVVHHRELDLGEPLSAFDAVETCATGREHVVRRVT